MTVQALDVYKRKFGKVTPFARGEPAAPGRTRPWRCLCDCGRDFLAFAHDLVRDKHQSCGCSQWPPPIEVVRLGDGELAGRIELTQGRYALIDVADIALVHPFNWYAARHPGAPQLWYARTNIRAAATSACQRTLRLHQLILGVPASAIIDHEDHDGLNCRRRNLRLATTSQNAQNRRANHGKRSPYKGVQPCGSKWSARIKHQGRLRHLGSFASEEAAARTYDAAAREIFGEFAALNFPAGPQTHEPTV